MRGYVRYPFDSSSMSGISPVLQAQNLQCLRGESLLFEGLSFGVASGEVLQIEGANGSGKTSLLRILAGLSPPSEGEVLWRGESVAGRRPAFFAEIAYLGHHLGLKGELSVLENLRFSFALNGVPPSSGRLEGALAEVGLADRADLPVRALSAGQRQRVALARMISSGAALWILDEPFTALDVSGIALIQRLLEEHAARGGLAVLTSHQAVELRGGLRKLVLA
jgi:heme exporter protein A